MTQLCLIVQNNNYLLILNLHCMTLLAQKPEGSFLKILHGHKVYLLAKDGIRSRVGNIFDRLDLLLL